MANSFDKLDQRKKRLLEDVDSLEALEELVVRTKDRATIYESQEIHWQEGDVRLDNTVCSLEQRPDSEQDRIFFAPNLGMLTVDDGVGGGYRGELAAALHGYTSLRYAEKYKTKTSEEAEVLFRHIVKEVERKLSTWRKEENWDKRSTTCAISAYVHPNAAGYYSGEQAIRRTKVTLALVGDCQAWKLRVNGEISPIFTPDRPNTNKTENSYKAKRDPQANYVGGIIGAAESHLHLRYEDVRLEEGEGLLLATDGLDDNLDTEIPISEIRRATHPVWLAQSVLRTNEAERNNPDLVHKNIQQALAANRLVTDPLKQYFGERLQQAFDFRTAHPSTPNKGHHGGIMLEELWGMPTMEDLLQASIREGAIDAPLFTRKLKERLQLKNMRKPDDCGFAVMIPTVIEK